MSTEFVISWPTDVPPRGGRLKDIPGGTLVQDLDYSRGGMFGYWDGAGIFWFYGDHIITHYPSDGSHDNCVAVPNAKITIKIEIEE